MSGNQQKNKRNAQLGMDGGTASNRLLKDILFKLITDAGHVCYHCGFPMSRSTFSIEHKEPWLDSSDPVKLFFDLENIGFSHKVCNFAARRHGGGAPKKYATDEERLEARRTAGREYAAKRYCPKRRREIYLRTGK